MHRHVAISGCSGGGKSSLLAELARRGYAVVEEPGRRIVAAEQVAGGATLPWIDGIAFARRALAMALADRGTAQSPDDWVFFDRGLIDAAVALEHLTGVPAAGTLTGTPRYHDTVFLAPPWPEIYATDAARRHGYDEAVAEYERLAAAWPALGYQVAMLPKADIAPRADVVIAVLTG